MEAFTFAVSTQVDFPIYVKIGSLEGKQKQIPLSVLLKQPELRHIGSVQNPLSDLFVTAQLWSESKPLGVPLQTSYKAFKTARAWNEWLQLPMSIKEAPLKCQLAITIWDLSPLGGEGADGHYIPFGGTTIRLFDDEGKLKTGKQKCKVHRHKAADGFSATTTPSSPPKKRRGNKPDPLGPSPEELELERVEVLIKKHEMEEIPQIDWMDQLVFRQLERLKLNAD
ncbi:C2 domain-containing protein, partial [Aspergillus falconensis]